MQFTSGLALHRTPSAGTIIKKIVEINPELGVAEIGALIRAASSRRGGPALEYSDVEVIDEGKALELARATVSSARGLER